MKTSVFLLLLLAVMTLAGCAGDPSNNSGEALPPADSTPAVSDSPTVSTAKRIQNMPDAPETSEPPDNSDGQETAQIVQPLSQEYMQGEFWRIVEYSGDLLPLADGETSASYFERIHSEAEAEAEQYIQETCLPLEENFQKDYGGTKTGATFYQDSRIDRLTPGGVFCKDGRRYLVYTLDYSVKAASGAWLVLAGGMGEDKDGWMNPGLGCVLALSLEDDGSIKLCFGIQTDIFPDNQEFFQQAFSEMLAQNQLENGV